MAEAAIVEWSLVSCFGHDVRTACAAARAGLSRSGALPELESADGFNDVAPLIGHQIPLCAEGLEGDARLSQILATTLSSVAQLLRTRGVGWSEVGVYLALPPALDVEDNGADDNEDEEKQQPLDAAGVFARACSWSGLRDTLRLGYGCRSPAAWPLALRAALTQLQGSKERYGLVCAVDSYFDGVKIAAAQEAGLLKTPQNATGPIPGEAGVALLLERPGARAGAAIISEFTSNGPLTAPMLVELLKARGADPHHPWLLADQTGGYEAAMQWGTLLTALGPSCEPTIWYPATHFGDVGNAFSGTGVCMAIEAARRSYAAAGTALIISSDRGSAAVTVVQTKR